MAHSQYWNHRSLVNQPMLENNYLALTDKLSSYNTSNKYEHTIFTYKSLTQFNTKSIGYKDDIYGPRY